MTAHGEQCVRCRQLVRPGAAYCTHCGAPLNNRGARIDRNLSQQGSAMKPGRIAVASAQPGSQVLPPAWGRLEIEEGPEQYQPDHGGRTGMITKLDLVPASAGKRLGAAVLDWLGPLVVLSVALIVGVAGISTSRRNGFIVYDTALLVLLGGIGAGLTVLYAIVVASIEARSGNTVGNHVMGIRSADADGYAPGGGAVFLRGLVTGAGVLLAALAAAVLMMLGLFGVAMWLVPALLILGTAWAVLVVVSNSHDQEGGLRGWHDKAAKTLAFDIKEGRNPVQTGGIQGPYSFAPIELPPVQPVHSPAPSQAAVVPPSAPGLPVPERLPAPELSPVAKPLEVPHTLPLHPDDDVDRTQLRSGTRPPEEAVLRIKLDDGQDIRLAGTALLGRNPQAPPGEDAEQLVPVSDPGRTISKTHLRLRLADGGVWVTDRNSTNGSAVITPDGARTRLIPGQEVFIRPGSTVQFGDRTFHLGQA